MEFTQVEVNVMIRFEKDVSGNIHIAELPITYAYNLGTGSIKFYKDGDKTFESATDSFLKWYLPAKIEEGIKEAVQKKKKWIENIFKNQMYNCRSKYTMLCLLLPF